VKSVAERVRDIGAPVRWPRIASVGPATTDALREHLPEIEVACEPTSEFRAESLLAAFRDDDVRGRRMLLPISDRARDVLAEGLLARGAQVQRVVAYRTVAPAEAGPALARALAEGVDVVTFASPSAVENFVDVAPARGVGTRAAVIGPVTEERARALGLDVVVTARPSTAEGLATALERAFAAD
jgi:uroporphyrinogen III methyltransferase/synthase